MKEKTLKTIQTIINVANILVSIAQVFLFIAVIFTAIATVAIAYLKDGFVVGGVDLNSMIYENTNLSKGDMISSMGGSVVMMIGELMIIGALKKYFKEEKKDGTPFRMDLSLKLKKVGIKAIVIPLVFGIIASIVYWTLRTIYGGDMADYTPDGIETFGLGIVLIIMSCLTKYGAISDAEKDLENV